MTGVDTDRFERKKRVATSFSYVKLPNLYLAATGISCLMLATCAFALYHITLVPTGKIAYE